ncbi:MAG TPA: trypsin-like peptidase domain-containing protein [Rhizomicrobium sp.]|jgi:S1-C subfamily serine protease
MRSFASVVLALVLAGCTSSSGDPAPGFIGPAVAAAYIPLGGSAHLVMVMHGAAVVFAPGVAVTAAHNDTIVDSASVIGKAAESDLLFFRTARTAPLATAAPQEGEPVIAYGQDNNGGLRVAYGTIRKLHVPVKPFCAGCAPQDAFLFEANAGPGFSGGPVLDAKDGRLVGIVFGYLDPGEVADKTAMNVSGAARAMYAYDMAQVAAAFSALQNR